MRTLRFFRFLLPLLLFLFSAGMLCAESYLDKRVVVHLKGGSTVTGLVVEENDDGSIRVQISGGSALLRKDRILKIVITLPPRDEYLERSRQCKTAADWVKLAKWCGQGDVRLPDERKRCLDEALKLDPDHEGARLELGHIKVNDKWYPEDEGNELLGKVKVDGKWYPPDEAERIKRKKELLSKNSVLKGLLQQEVERMGIPWAEAAPQESEHYSVKCNSTVAVAKRYSDVMEGLYRAYDEVFPESTYPRYSQEKGVIYIFRNNHEFIDFTMVPPGVGGFFSFADRAVRAYHGSFGVTGSTEMVLAHEATHQFQFRIMNDMRSVPSWLIEGMAVYYGDGTEIDRRKVELHKIPRDRLQTLQEAIRTKRYTPLQQLIRIPQGAFGGQYYDHGWGVIYWCLQGEKYKAHKGEGKRVWDQYLKHVCQDSPKITTVMMSFMEHLEKEAQYFEQLLLKETGYESIEAWEEEYKKFILGLELEQLGTWKGRTWDGSSKVGLKLQFPTGLRHVEESELRPQLREAAAAQSREGDVRMWAMVEANWLKEARLDTDMVNSFVHGFFNDVAYTDEGQPKQIKVNEALDFVVATFKGRMAERREVNVNALSDDEKKETGGSKGASKETEPIFDPKSQLKVTLALTTTADKVYLIILAGLEAPFSKIEPQFSASLESVVLSF